MPRLNDRIPTYRRHRASGQAVVTLSGEDHYLGPHGTAASRWEYDRLISEWIAGGRRQAADPAAVTVGEVVNDFRKHAQTYYRDAEGNISREVNNIDDAVRELLRLYGKTRAVEFGPLRLKAVRQAMLAAGLVRTNINRRVSRIRHVFKWATENEMIEPSVFHGLLAVAGLRAGRSEAKESEPVTPVALAHVEATKRHLPPCINAMIDLQTLTGMRPGEVCAMRTADVDTKGKLWLYKPARHKTQHHGHARTVYLGPRAIEVLKPHLRSDLSAFIFQPADAEAWHRQQRRGSARKHRKSALIGAGEKAGDRWIVDAYRRAIERACDVAFPPASELLRGRVKSEKGPNRTRRETPAEWRERLGPDKWQTLTDWRVSHRWHPHQLRHTAATELRKSHGLEAAQVLLGHKTLSITEVYAEKNVQAAMRIAAEVG